MDVTGCHIEGAMTGIRKAKVSPRTTKALVNKSKPKAKGKTKKK